MWGQKGRKQRTTRNGSWDTSCPHCCLPSREKARLCQEARALPNLEACHAGEEYLRVRLAVLDEVACHDVVEELEELRVQRRLEVEVPLVRRCGDCYANAMAVQVADEPLHARQ